MDMSCVDLLRGLPLLVAPPSADLLWHGPVLGDDGLGLGGGDWGGVGVAEDKGVPRVPPVAAVTSEAVLSEIVDGIPLRRQTSDDCCVREG
jgi:hypothetical protein